ncbi:MAG: hypothetical protein IJI67_06640 [Clostridia bacterium]|nr:hypothetical protein [Clostridia bacterium]
MKRIFCILLAALLLLSFAACSKNKNKDKTTTATTTAATSTTQKQTSQATTAKEGTTAKKTDISYIYKGFWYKNESNKVVVLQFSKDGKVTVNLYRRNSLADGADAPDSTSKGSFQDNGDGTLRVFLDSEQQDTFDVYKVSADGTLICQNDDPEGSSTIQLQHFDTLDSDNAATVLFGDN